LTKKNQDVGDIRVFHFQLPRMEYEGSIGLVSRKMKKKIIADFHVLALFMAKKQDLSEKKKSVCHEPL
jgi:hypothetical protein